MTRTDHTGWMTPSRVLCLMIVAAFLLQAELALSRGINWDEFFHFSQIHRRLQDRPLQWLQVPFVWLFWWVPSLPGDGIWHIQLIRLLMLPFGALTVAAIIAAARTLGNRDAALLCGLLYVTGGYVFLHAHALRADMIAAGLLTLALAIAIRGRPRMREALAIAALICLAFASTIKSVLYAPAFFGVLMYRLPTSRLRMVFSALCLLAIAAGSLLLYSAPALSPTEGATFVRDIAVLGRASVERMFLAGAVPQAGWIRGQLLSAPVLTVGLVATFVSTLDRSRPSLERMLQVFLILPLLTVAFYRNAYPYHYAFILPPAVIAIAPALPILLARFRPILIGATALLGALVLSWMQDRAVIDRQRTVLAGIHEIFASPVTYIDDCGIVGDFPRAVNHYASGWGLQNYRRRAVPTYSLAIAAEPVPMLLADHDRPGTICFDLLLRNALLEEDARILRDHYIHHWGNVFVPGARFQEGASEQTFTIVVEGPYTVENGAVIIDGRSLEPGSVIPLSRGEHRAMGEDLDQIVLRWGNHLTRPAYPWPTGRLFTVF